MMRQDANLFQLLFSLCPLPFTSNQLKLYPPSNISLWGERSVVNHKTTCQVIICSCHEQTDSIPAYGPRLFTEIFYQEPTAASISLARSGNRLLRLLRRFWTLRNFKDQLHSRFRPDNFRAYGADFQGGGGRGGLMRTRRHELKPYCVSPLILGSLLATSRSAIGQFFLLSPVTAAEFFAKVNSAKFPSRV